MKKSEIIRDWIMTGSIVAIILVSTLTPFINR